MTVGRTDHHIDLEAVMVGMADPHKVRAATARRSTGRETPRALEAV